MSERDPPEMLSLVLLLVVLVPYVAREVRCAWKLTMTGKRNFGGCTFPIIILSFHIDLLLRWPWIQSEYVRLNKQKRPQTAYVTVNKQF